MDVAGFDFSEIASEGVAQSLKAAQDRATAENTYCILQSELCPLIIDPSAQVNGFTL